MDNITNADLKDAMAPGAVKRPGHHDLVEGQCAGSPRPMTCRSCGDYAGRFEQHPYMPRGQSLCPSCTPVVSRITDPLVMRKQYGEAGVNYPSVGTD